MGRRGAEKWAPRPLDLDIVLFDDVVLGDSELVLPHPRFGERAFVLRPLLDLDPDLADPRSGERLELMLRRLSVPEPAIVGAKGWQELTGLTGS